MPITYTPETIQPLMQDLAKITWQPHSRAQSKSADEALKLLNAREWKKFQHPELLAIIRHHTAIERTAPGPNGTQDARLGFWGRRDLISFLRKWDALRDERQDQGVDGTITRDEGRRLVDEVWEEVRARQRGSAPVGGEAAGQAEEKERGEGLSGTDGPGIGGEERSSEGEE